MKIARAVSTKAMIRLASTLAAVLSIAMTLPVSAAPSEKEILGWIQQASRNEERRVDFPDIQESLSKGDYLGAETLATAAINKKGDGEKPQSEAWLRAEAFRLRAVARQSLYSDDARLMIRDLAESAKLGNLLAIRALVSMLVPIAAKSGPLDEMRLMITQVAVGVDLNEIIAVGVDVGEPTSIRAAIENPGLPHYSAEQVIFLMLLAGVKSKDPDLIRAIEAAQRTMDFGKLMRENAFVGGPLPANASGRAGRDALATLFAEDRFRWKLRREFAISMQIKKLEKELTVRESFAIVSYGVDQTGMASAYFLAREDTGLGSRSLVMSSDEIARAIGPGDRLFVRCGPLAHVAAVFSVDPAHDEIVFVDGFFEFWKPSHNACVHEFSQVHWKYGYFHTKLKLSEVLAMLVGVQSFRSYELPVQVEQIGGSAAESKGVTQKIAHGSTAGCARVTNGPDRIIGSRFQDFPKRELFRYGDLEEFADRPLGSGIRSKIFVPRALNNRSRIVVALRTDANGCVGSASVFLRRSVLTAPTERTDYSTVMFGILGLEAFGEGGFKSVVEDMERESSDTNHKLVKQFSAVMDGRLESMTLKSGALNVFLGNFNSDTGVRWIRVDIW